MKKYIISLIFLMGIANFLYPFDESKVEVKTGDFYFLVGTEGNERAIMYLHILGTNAYGSYYTESQSIEFHEYYGGSFDGKNLRLGDINGTLSGDIVFRGKHNSKNVNLSLANAPINTMKIFDYNYNIGENNDGDVNLSYSSRDIIHPRDYNERKLINDYNKIVNSDENEMHNIDIFYGAWYDYCAIVYIDDRIVTFNYSGTGDGYYGGARQYDWCNYITYPVNSKLEKEIELSDFIANTKDKRLLSLITNKFYELNKDIWEDEFFGGIAKNSMEEYGIDDIEYCNFSISPKGAITIYYNVGFSYLVILEATFTFEELKPFIKRGSPLDYLFN